MNVQLSLFSLVEPVCPCGKPGLYQAAIDATFRCATCLVKFIAAWYPKIAPSEVVARTCEHCNTVVDRADQLHLCFCDEQLNSCRKCLAAERGSAC